MITTIDIPQNRETIAYLLALRSVYDRPWERGEQIAVGFTDQAIDLRELRTHPDLGGLLSAAALELPGATHGYVLGYDVLVSPAGVIFALATGMQYLAFRIHAPGAAAQPAAAGQPSIAELNSEWHTYTPFGEVNPAEILSLARQALENVGRLAG